MVRARPEQTAPNTMEEGSHKTEPPPADQPSVDQPENLVDPHVRDPLAMRVHPHMVKPVEPLTAEEEDRRDELRNRGVMNADEEQELNSLMEREAPPPLTAEGKARLAFLQSRGPLSHEKEAKKKRLEGRPEEDRSPVEKQELADLVAEGPRTKEEDEEMSLLQKAADERARYEKDRSDRMEKKAAGPFSIEQWRHITAYIEAAIQHRASHRGRLPPGMVP